MPDEAKRYTFLLPDYMKPAKETITKAGIHLVDYVGREMHRMGHDVAISAVVLTLAYNTLIWNLNAQAGSWNLYELVQQLFILNNEVMPDELQEQLMEIDKRVGIMQEGKILLPGMPGFHLPNQQ